MKKFTLALFSLSIRFPSLHSGLHSSYQRAKISYLQKYMYEDLLVTAVGEYPKYKTSVATSAPSRMMPIMLKYVHSSEHSQSKLGRHLKSD